MKDDNKVLGLFNRIKALEVKGVNVINFAFGAPGFDTPEVIQLATAEALHTRRNPLIPLEGISDLRKEICDYIDRTRGFRPELDQILVGPSAKIMLFTTLSAILSHGDEVVTLNPCLPYYNRLAEFLGAKVINSPFIKKENFKIDLKKLESVIGKKTKAILISTPHNPTGIVLTNTELQQLSEMAEKNEVFIISDETYNQIILNGRHISPAIVDRAQEYSIILESLSYTFSVASWGLGFYVVPKHILGTLKNAIADLTSPVPNFIQYAGVKAFQNADKLIPNMLERYKKCAKTLVDGLNELPGFNCALPSGGIHAFPDISGTGYSSLELAEYLLEKAGIAVLPGDIFGSRGKNHIRLSFSNSIEYINEGLMRLDESF